LSLDTPSIFANARVVVDARQTARQLAPLLAMPVGVLTERLSSDRGFVWLKRWVSSDVETKVKNLNLPGIEIVSEPKRFYPQKEIAAQIVGFVGTDSRGLEGMEQKLEDQIAGEAQVVTAFRDARGEKVLTGGLDPDDKTRGADVRLTIDLKIQHAVQDILQDTVKSTQARFAMAVVLDVPTAEILAMGMAPSFDPNRNDANVFRRNRVVTDLFEPGSTLKPLVVAAALDAGVIKPQSTFFCENGKYKVGKHIIHDVESNGLLNITQIVAFSSNIGMTKIGEKLGREKLYKALKAYGFGDETGIDFPGEISGILHAPKNWSQVGLANISFGQGIAVTALQMAAAYRVLASYGMYKTPRLVRWYEHSDGSVLYPENLGYVPYERRVLKPGSASAVIDMMRAVVGVEGTGRRAELAGYSVAGKTGTAQKVTNKAYSHDKYTALFGGFLPAEDPEVVIVVAVDEPQGEHRAGMIAAPVFSQIAKATMNSLHILPTAGQ
jgi:cell division protein FtsI (penicillin-binding protein 3)